MARETSWYDRQALISKLLTYAAMLVLLASLGLGGYEVYAQNVSSGMYLAIAGVAAAAIITGFSAIIDLLIVNAEALRVLKR